MKNRFKIGWFSLLSLCCTTGMAQSIAFKADYTLKTSTSFHVDKDVADSMTLYDDIKLMPIIVEDDYSETFYDDGSVEKEVIHSYPNGLPEAWLAKAERTVFTKDSAFAYVNGTIFSRMPLKPFIIPIDEIAPHYLGTASWDLPLNQEQLNNLQSSGANVITNNHTTLFFEYGNMSVLMNKALMIHEVCEYDNNKQISSNLRTYKKDENGFYVYDYTVDRTLICDDEDKPCVEKVTVNEYSNINKEYIDQTLAPVHNDSSVVFPTITASQLGNTQSIQVNFSNDCPDQILVNIMDLYGNIKESNVLVTKQNNTIYSQNLQLGLHLIEVLTPSVQSCTFMYIP